jgi:hypothetical protein
MSVSRRRFLRMGGLTSIGLALRALVGERKTYAEGSLVNTPTATPSCTPVIVPTPISGATALQWVKYAGESAIGVICPLFDSNWDEDDPNKVVTKHLLNKIVKALSTQIDTNPNDYQGAASILLRVVRVLRRVRVNNFAPPEVNPCRDVSDATQQVLCCMQSIDTLVRGIYQILVQEGATPTPTPTPPGCNNTIEGYSKDIGAVVQVIAPLLGFHNKNASKS